MKEFSRYMVFQIATVGFNIPLEQLDFRPGLFLIYQILDEEKNGCSERPITLCAIVKGGTCKGSLIWHRHEVRRNNYIHLFLFI